MSNFVRSILILMVVIPLAPVMGQVCPDLPTECRRHEPPCPYPEDDISPSERAALRAAIGPWTTTVQESRRMGLAESYRTAEDLRQAAWGLPQAVEGVLWSYLAPGATGRHGSAWWVIGEVLKPAPAGGRSWLDLGTGEVGHTALAIFEDYYGSPPTIGQYIRLDAHHLGAGAPGRRWWPDNRFADSRQCGDAIKNPNIFPTSQPSWSELGWMVQWNRLRALGLKLRNQAGEVVTPEMITCHFRPASSDCTGSPPTQPPPPEPPPEECPECPDDPDLPECPGACKDLARATETMLESPRWMILPDGTAQPSKKDDGRYQFVPQWLRPLVIKLIGECKVEAGCYTPGIPSTGKLEPMLLPGPEGEHSTAEATTHE